MFSVCERECNILWLLPGWKGVEIETLDSNAPQKSYVKHDENMFIVIVGCCGCLISEACKGDWEAATEIITASHS